MSDDPKTTAKKGDWVLVWGQVKKPDIITGETSVEFESHNSNWDGLIRNAHLVLTDQMPPDAYPCTSVFEVLVWVQGKDDPRRLLTKCLRHHGHSERHVDAKEVRWTDKQEYGHVEVNG